MKKFIILLSLLFGGIAQADTITVNWLNENNTNFTTSVCTVGEDLQIPTTPPTKYGYTFTGWQLLPYIPLEYIVNVPSNTYFNTGFIPNSDSKFVVDYVSIENLDPDGGCPIVATSFKYGNYSAFRQDSSMNKTYPNHPRWFFNGKTSYAANRANARHTYSLSKNGWYIDGAKTATTNADAVFTATTPFYIFAESSSLISKCTVMLYSVQLYQNDELVHDYVPAMTLDGESVGLYDKMTNVFLYNLGTEPAIAGPTL